MTRYLLILALIFCTFNITAQKVLIPYRVKDKWGYSDTSGKLKIKPRFEQAFLFEGDYAPVNLNTGEGLISRSGKLIIPPIYYDLDIQGYWEEINGPIFYKTVIAKTKSNKIGLYALPSGKLVIDTVNTSIFNVYGTLLHVSTMGRKEGIFDERISKWIAEPVYDYASPLNDTVIAVQGDREFRIPILANGPGPITERPLQPLILEETKIVKLSEAKAVSVVKPAVAKKPTGAELNAARLYKHNGLYGFRFAGQFEGDSIPPIYDSIDRYSEYTGLLAAKKDGKWGVINSKNKEMLPFRYDAVYIYHYSNENLYYVVSEGKQKAVLLASGDILTSGYDQIIHGDKAFFILKKGNLYGVLFTGYNEKPLLLEPQFLKVEERSEMVQRGYNNVYLLKVVSGKDQPHYSYISSTGRKFFVD